jgi:hypothetical protein
VALLVWLLDRRYRFGRGRAFALYVMAYTAGRAWIEYLRIDTANHILGLRLNDWTSIIVFIGALIYFVKVRGPRVDLVPATNDDGTRDDLDSEAGTGDDAADDAAGTDTAADAPRPVDAEAEDPAAATAGDADEETAQPAKTKR